MKYSWVLLSLFLAIITACRSLIYKYMSNIYNSNNNIFLLSLITIAIAGLLTLPILCYRSKEVVSIYKDINKNHKNFKILIPVIAIIIILNITFTIMAFNKVENPAYSNIIINMNVLFVLLFSIILFKSKINIKSILGVILCIIGITFIIINN